MSTPSWLPLAISASGTIIALSAFAYQVDRARFNQSIDLLFRLENDFSGPAKRIQRARACHDLQRGNALEAEPILDFFETMALLLRRGALDVEMVWHTFDYWLEHYYQALKSHIEERQKTDPLLWEDLPKLINATRKIQAKRSRIATPRQFTPEQISAFLREEQTEISK